MHPHSRSSSSRQGLPISVPRMVDFDKEFPCPATLESLCQLKENGDPKEIKVLPCGHSYSEEGLVDIEDEDSKVYTCTLCGKKFASAANNYTAQDMSKRLIQLNEDCETVYKENAQLTSLVKGNVTQLRATQEELAKNREEREEYKRFQGEVMESLGLISQSIDGVSKRIQEIEDTPPRSLL